ncbi:MAG: AAA family ATPase [Bacteroidota bacterium]
MKILAIRIKNMASLEGETEIDFTQEPLCSAGIFAITGPMGAGKSTILDALCLALYAKTPRYTQAKETGIDIRDVGDATITQGDIRGILRRGSSEGYAEVDFVGIDGQSYRSQWSIRRARNKAEGTLQAYNVSLKNIDTDVIYSGTKTEILPEIERLVGLNFDQFTRSVLLAQGDFTAFLKAGKDEKSSLLEKLTGSQIYSEISKRIFEKHRQEAQELENFNFQKQGVVLLTPEELEAFAARKEELGTIILASDKAVFELSKEETWYEQFGAFKIKLEEANASHEQADTIKKNGLDRELKLKQTEVVQSAREFVQGLQTNQNQLNSKTTALKDLVENLVNIQKQKNESDLFLKKAQEDLTVKNKYREDAQPQLNEAKKLDVQVKDREQQVKNAAEELKNANEGFQKQGKQLKEQQQKSIELQTSIDQLNQWKDKNKDRQGIADNHTLILSKLIDAQQLLDFLQSTSVKIQTTTQSIKKKEKEKEHFDKQLFSFQTTQEANLKSYQDKQKEIAAVNIGKLEKDKSTADTLLQEIVQANADWKILYGTMKSFESIKATLAENKKKLNTGKKEQTLAVKQFETAKTKRETSLHSLKVVRLASAENVETLRDQLVELEPCPVCGSKEHPYAIHNPQLNKVLAKLEDDHKQHEINYEKSLQEHSSLNEICNQLQKAIDALTTDLTLKDGEIKEQKENWQQFSMYEDFNSLINEEVTASLQQHLRKQKVLQKKLDEQMLSYKTKKQQLDHQKEEQGELGKQIDIISNAIKDFERSQKSLKEQLAQYQGDQEKTNIALSETQTALSIYFITKSWFENWKTNAGDFVKDIRQFADLWKANTLKLDEGIYQQGILTATLKSSQEQTKLLADEVTKKATAHNGFILQRDDLQKQRMALFNGQEVQTVEEDLQKAIETARGQLDKCKTDIEKLGTTITRFVTQKEETEKDIKVLRQNFIGFKEKIDKWLLAYNAQYTTVLDQNSLDQLLAHTPEWIETERKALREIDNLLIQAQTVLNERKTALEKHQLERLSDRSLEKITELLYETKAILQNATKENTEIGLRLQQDAENLEKTGELLTVIKVKEKIVENWARLNQIIGSADGKKFRQVAQEYTLDVLLDYANMQLDMLSKRYILQRIPQSLGLQVLDQDMGNEVRTVFSLSGGESFLVSLALALGLASLSSTRMKVESLFIDEGFGSLDHNTLNTAMDALERLHNQGRKVGVISHVLEMTERIPVQIKVNKHNNGKSKVEITGV